MTPAVFPAAPSDLTAALWQAYQQSRGTADAVAHMDYLLTLFWLKCLDQEQWSLAAASPKQPARWLPSLVVPAAAQFATLLAQRLTPQLGARLDEALAALTAANPDVLTDVFTHVVFAEPAHVSAAAARDRYLQQQLALVDALPLPAATQESARAPGRAASALIARVARPLGKSGSAWCTPPEVADLLARLLAPQAGERLSDPHCGSGALLAALAEQVDPQQVSWSGQEPDPAAYGRGRLRLLLYGLPHAQLVLGDTLRSPRLLDAQGLQPADVVATQPPLTTRGWGHELAAQDPYHRFWRGVPPATQGDFAYISHVLATLPGPAGRAGLLVGHGALYRTGQDGRIRQQLLEENLLDAVISLPAQVVPGLNSPLAILLFRRGRTRQDVLFVEASAAPGLAPATSVLGDEELARLVQAYRTYAAAPPYARCVPLTELRQHQYNLSPARYLPPSVPEVGGTLREAQAEILHLERELLGVQAELQTCWQALGIAASD